MKRTDWISELDPSLSIMDFYHPQTDPRPRCDFEYPPSGKTIGASEAIGGLGHVHLCQNLAKDSTQFCLLHQPGRHQLCGAETTTGGTCQKPVAEGLDRCWQHPRKDTTMGALDKAAKAAQNSQGSTPRPQQPARKVDLNRTPSGYDQDIWELAVNFNAVAEGRGVKLKAGLPVIYAMLERRLEESATGLWLTDRPLAIERIKLMIGHYWTEFVDPGYPEWGADDFCSPVTFKEVHDWMLNALIAAARIPGDKQPMKRERKPAKPPVEANPTQSWKDFNAEMRRKRDGLA